MTLAEKKAKAKAEAEEKKAQEAVQARTNLFAKLLGKTASLSNQTKSKLSKQKQNMRN